MRNISAIFLLLSTGCFFRDNDALYEKIVVECRLFPGVPICALNPENTNSEIVRKSFDIWADNTIDNPSEQECILAVDCSDTENHFQEINECTNQVKQLLLARNSDCIRKCGDEYANCGPDNCSELDVDICHRQFKICKRLCPPGS